MKLLVDQNLSPSLVDQLASAGHEALHAATVGLANADDPAVFEWCRANNAVLVTADKKRTKFLVTERAGCLAALSTAVDTETSTCDVAGQPTAVSAGSGSSMVISRPCSKSSGR